ncbi:MAG: hypothetical protein JXA54_04450 [Candidatus Heimdallarchaeota archaeon]|nr:hypothetical protein [Candidatus Heimdallarchaeota archaeon]
MGIQYKEETDNKSLLEDEDEINGNDHTEFLKSRTSEDEVPELKQYSGKTFVIELAAGAILGGLSVLLGFTWDAYVESIMGSVTFAPGMSWFDIMAVPILVAFFVFSVRSGMIAAIIGCGSIIFYLSEPYGWLAMQPKFVASVSMFLIPWIFLKIVKKRQMRKNKETKFLQRFKYSTETFKPIVNYIILMGVAIIGRAIVMFGFNLFVTLPLYGWLFSDRTTFAWVGTDPKFFLITSALYSSWNLVQGVADAVISYLIVYPTRLYKLYSTW